MFKDLEADTDAIMGEDTAPATTGSGGTEVSVAEGQPRSASSQSGTKKDQQLQPSSSSPIDQGQNTTVTSTVTSTAASENQKKEVSKDGI